MGVAYGRVDSGVVVVWKDHGEIFRARVVFVRNVRQDRVLSRGLVTRYMGGKKDVARIRVAEVRLPWELTRRLDHRNRQVEIAGGQDDVRLVAGMRLQDG